MKVITIPTFALDGLCHQYPTRYPFLLESVINNHSNRYSILFAFPEETIVLNHLTEFDFLTQLESKITNTNGNTELPFTGGWFVYLSYEFIGQIETTLASSLLAGSTPVAIAVKIPTAVIKDHQNQQTYLLDEFANDSRMQQVLDDINSLETVPKGDFSGNLEEEGAAQFLSSTDRIKDYIKAGDVFQVNLSRGWQYQLNRTHSATQVYQALKQTNPAPFSALAQFDAFSIVSSSPERLFNVNQNVVEARPIAGTHPRGQGSEDKALKHRLINHPKERSEHIMLLDLERNDLGRVCEYGSIKVNEMMALETYPFVHHIVSNIQGKLKKSTTIKHLIQALFPGGTITGCPKIRCMQIIAELEQVPRQAYTGSLGYISSNGKIDFNILIRSMMQQGNALSFRAGSGIVFDSIAQKELEETRHKAQGILKIFESKSCYKKNNTLDEQN